MDFYRILDIPKTSYESDIKRAYKKLILCNNLQCCYEKELFKQITHAYYILSNHEFRRIYDLYGYDGLLDNEIYVFDVNCVEIYKSVFTDKIPQQLDSIAIDNNIYLQETVNLNDIYNGRYTTRTIQRKILCTNCNGTGSCDGKLHICKKCRGKKVLLNIVNNSAVLSKCNYCDGIGIDKSINICIKCTGARTVLEDYDMAFLVSIGIEDGEIITLKNQGNINIGNNIKDDIIVKIKYDIDKKYVLLNNKDLSTTCDIELVNALCKQPFHITLPNNTDYIYQPSCILIENIEICIDNAGLPNKNNQDKCGKLFVKLHITFPQSLTQEQMNQLIHILKN